MADDMTPLFQMIVDRLPPPKVGRDGSFSIQISVLDYNSYVGVTVIGRITRGGIKPKSPVTVVRRDGGKRNGRILQVMGNLGLERVPVDVAEARDVICITGIADAEYFRHDLSSRCARSTAAADRR
jgi:GTP-binding protein